MTNPASGGGWYVITYRKTPQDPFTVLVSQKPFPAGALVDSGPYGTKAEAEAAAAKLRNTLVPGLPSIPNPFSWVGAVSHWIGDAVLSITDVHMWISVGWILLGFIMVVLGINLWLKIPQKLFKAGTAAAAAA